MKHTHEYYWVRWGKNWVIAIYEEDDEQEKMCWYCNGMEIVNEPDEVGELIKRPETASTNIHVPDINIREAEDQLKSELDIYYSAKSRVNLLKRLLNKLK